MADRHQEEPRYYARRGRPMKSSTSETTTCTSADFNAPVLLCGVPTVVDPAKPSGVQTMRLKIKLWNTVDAQQQQAFPLVESDPVETLSPEEQAVIRFEENIRFLASKGFRGVRKSLLMELYRHLDFATLITGERVCHKFRSVLKDFLPEYREKGIVKVAADPPAANGSSGGPFVSQKSAYASMGPHIRLLLILGPEGAPSSGELSVTTDKKGNGRRTMPQRAAKSVTITVSTPFVRPEFEKPSKQQCLSIGQVLRYFWPRTNNIRLESTIIIRNATFHLNIFSNGLSSTLPHVQRLVFHNVYLYGVYMFLLYDSIAPSTDSPLKIAKANMVLNGIFTEDHSMVQDGSRQVSSGKKDVDEFLILLAPALEQAMFPVAESDRKALKERIKTRWREDTLRTFDIMDRILRKHEPQLCNGEDDRIPHVNNVNFKKLRPLTLRLLAWWEYAMAEVDKSEAEDELEEESF